MHLLPAKAQVQCSLHSKLMIFTFWNETSKCYKNDDYINGITLLLSWHDPVLQLKYLCSLLFRGSILAGCSKQLPGENDFILILLSFEEIHQVIIKNNLTQNSQLFEQ